MTLFARNSFLFWTLCTTYIQAFSYLPPSSSSSSSSSGSSSTNKQQRINNLSYENQIAEANYLFLTQNGSKQWGNRRTGEKSRRSTLLKASIESSDKNLEELSDKEKDLLEKNTIYVNSLLKNLGEALDKWIISGLPASRVKAHNIMKQIKRESRTEELIKRSERMAARAGLPLETPAPASASNPPTKSKFQPKYQSNNKIEHDTNVQGRKDDATSRKNWEESFQNNGSGENVRSAISSRLPDSMKKSTSVSQKATDFTQQMNNLDSNDGNKLDIFTFPKDKKDLQETLEQDANAAASVTASETEMTESENRHAEYERQLSKAITQNSELIACAGAGDAFSGEILGIGGLDDVLSQVKRRIWVPLAAPPSLLKELGINPVRGLLLYGKPGCGKTLLARTLGNILSPARPITVVSGPELMDKFVGSSEANLRRVFDSPPDLYPQYTTNNERMNQIAFRAALHVIVLDEFDAMARARGGSGGSGDQGDAGVARDSVVNQLLAKMDGVDGLGVPTLVIGLTNKRTLIEPALLRPGRFEVQIEVPPPKTVEQRVSILNVHMKNMFKAGRVLVKDAPEDSAASRRLQRNNCEEVLSYSDLTKKLAIETDGMSGASIAGVCRAAASHALERAVCDFAGSISENSKEIVQEEGRSIADCLVTQKDFEMAIKDVFESSKDGDFEEDEQDGEEETEEEEEEEKE